MTTTTAGKTTTARATPAAKSPASASRLASSIKFKTFAVAFGIVFPVMYVACEWWNLPLFTFHPATNRVDFWWAAGRSGEGPAMYWYGWTVTSLLVGLVVGGLATLLPESVTRKLPLFLVWLLPVLGFIPLAYSLMPFWTK
ncbi:MAG TPA: hypothetical protein VFB88_00540 [Xanthobacteraceae bacterium]|jgi:hypothetical protein|nr:hypothetical protein [Xanthobacteraceae bacterium]